MYEQALGLSRDISGNTDLKMLDLQTRSLNDALAVQKASWYPTLALRHPILDFDEQRARRLTGLRWNPTQWWGLRCRSRLFEEVSGIIR